MAKRVLTTSAAVAVTLGLALPALGCAPTPPECIAEDTPLGCVWGVPGGGSVDGPFDIDDPDDPGGDPFRPPGGTDRGKPRPGVTLPPGNEWFADDIWLDTYEIAGEIMGVPVKILSCALNFDTHWRYYTDEGSFDWTSQTSSGVRLDFESWDSSRNAGRVEGRWTIGMNYYEIERGSYTQHGAEGGYGPGTWELTLPYRGVYDPMEGDEPSYFSGTENVTFTLTAVVTPEDHETCYWGYLDLDELQSNLDNYEGPSGWGN